MALAEGEVATLVGASRRVAGLHEGVVGMGELMRVTREMWGGSQVELTHAGPLRAREPIPAAMTTYNRRKSVAGATVRMRATHFIILSPLGHPLGILAAAWAWWWRYDSRSSGGRDKPASGKRQQCAGGADAEGLGWLSEA
ncbi:hypothetical protein CYMTET_26947 [Cymbomonas tetramitiformis]|uniref:Uncharacterized protein n=1 Tax=Cymbomonas tetramitiformis TaxID=36881 RepID=A0AAE0FS89_9CHLO|nr:hypothetical protein CYMTET_26947 [Cymbomonas tetramitiformis]